MNTLNKSEIAAVASGPIFGRLAPLVPRHFRRRLRRG